MIVIPSILTTVVLGKSTTVTTARSVQVVKPAVRLLLLGESLLRSEVQSSNKRERLCVKQAVQSCDLVHNTVQSDSILHPN